MSNRQLIQERRQRRQQQKRLTAILVVSGIALIVTAILIVLSVQKRNFETSIKTAQGNTLGDPDAPVVIHEYSDFGCGHCAEYSATKAPLIIADYVETGQVFIEYHSVGDMLSPISAIAAEAAYCAGNQNKFWEYHDAIFANQNAVYQGTEEEINATLKEIAVTIGLDTDLFNQCVDSREYRERTLQDKNDAFKIGINSTPSFTINGTLLVGNLPYEQFQELIERELNQ